MIAMTPSTPKSASFVRNALLVSCLAALAPAAGARQWKFTGIAEPVEAEFVAADKGYVVLRGENGKSFEVPVANLSPADQKYVALLANGGNDGRNPTRGARPVTSRGGYQTKSTDSLSGQTVSVGEAMELRVTGSADSLAGSTIQFTAPDGWLILENVKPSVVEEKLMDRFVVNGKRAEAGGNVRVAAFGEGSVVIPHAPDFAAMTVFENPNLAGGSMDLKCYENYDDGKLRTLKRSISSFVLRRGYMATLASEENGTGASRNYVAQDHDVVVDALPKDLDDQVRFIRIFPWRWTSKKGIAGAIHENLNVGWFYDWNIGRNSSPDLEYVAIKQKRWWPGLNQDWRARGVNHLLGFNEPDKADQAKMTVDEAVAGWPELLGTGLRLGSPAVSDGGLNWLYQFMDRAEEKKLRVDFVAIHYYRAVGDPGDAKGAADQMFRFLKGVHDRTRRPLWVTEWNNGANWTSAPDPDERQQKAAIAEMIRMLDETPFVERYALYNWVEKVRHVKNDDGSLTPAGEVYRDQKSPVFFVQPKSAR